MLDPIYESRSKKSKSRFPRRARLRRLALMSWSEVGTVFALGFSEECLFSNNRFINRVNNTLVTVNNYGPETGLLKSVE